MIVLGWGFLTGLRNAYHVNGRPMLYPKDKGHRPDLRLPKRIILWLKPLMKVRMAVLEWGVGIWTITSDFIRVTTQHGLLGRLPARLFELLE